MMKIRTNAKELRLTEALVIANKKVRIDSFASKPHVIGSACGIRS